MIELDLPLVRSNSQKLPLYSQNPKNDHFPFWWSDQISCGIMIQTWSNGSYEFIMLMCCSFFDSDSIIMVIWGTKGKGKRELPLETEEVRLVLCVGGQGEGKTVRLWALLGILVCLLCPFCLMMKTLKTNFYLLLLLIWLLPMQRFFSFFFLALLLLLWTFALNNCLDAL